MQDMRVLVMVPMFAEARGPLDAETLKKGAPRPGDEHARRQADGPSASPHGSSSSRPSNDYDEHQLHVSESKGHPLDWQSCNYNMFLAHNRLKSSVRTLAPENATRLPRQPTLAQTEHRRIDRAARASPHATLARVRKIAAPTRARYM